MNSDNRDALEGIAKAASAIITCPTCRSYDISAQDDDAEKRAYAIAVNEWKAGEFCGSSHEEVKNGMQGVLQDANIDCPQCDRKWED